MLMPSGPLFEVEYVQLSTVCMVNGMNEKLGEQKSDKAYRLAFEYESKYGCCPQCVIAAIEDVFNLKMDDVFKAGHRDKCPDVAGKVARWVSEIILVSDEVI